MKYGFIFVIFFFFFPLFFSSLWLSGREKLQCPSLPSLVAFLFIIFSLLKVWKCLGTFSEGRVGGGGCRASRTTLTAASAPPPPNPCAVIPGLAEPRSHFVPPIPPPAFGWRSSWGFCLSLLFPSAPVCSGGWEQRREVKAFVPFSSSRMELGSLGLLPGAVPCNAARRPLPSPCTQQPPGLPGTLLCMGWGGGGFAPSSCGRLGVPHDAPQWGLSRSQLWG